ncbi:MAG: ABC transporter ATP-binding protein [Actinomycetaceae bacterium]|nr:ABC transporter ATP-binding protein [Actinomycetaceae bacterium]MDU0970418.1 ABC transporter ATP-binding protein [Actinomycetaceae bacterium]
MADVVLDNVTRTYSGAPYAAVNHVSLTIPDGCFAVLAGPHASGKSTLIRLIAGLEAPDSGHILFDGVDVTRQPSASRNCALVFHSYALYPHLSIADNLGFALRVSGVDEQTIAQRVAEVAALLTIEPYLDRNPRGLAPDVRQKVALGRALVRQPNLLILDEALATLPTQLADSMRGQLRDLHDHFGITTLYATARVDEAEELDAYTVVLDRGKVSAQGTYSDVMRSYRHIDRLAPKA